MVTWKSVWNVASEELMRLLRPEDDSWYEFGYKTVPAEAVEQDFALGEQPHLIEIETAIDTWVSGKDWPDLSDGARHCIRMRLMQQPRLYIFSSIPKRKPLILAHHKIRLNGR